MHIGSMVLVQFSHGKFLIDRSLSTSDLIHTLQDDLSVVPVLDF